MSDVPGRDAVEEEFDPADITDELEPEPDEPEGDVDDGDDEPDPRFREEDEGEEPAPAAATPRQGRKGEAQRYRERAERLEREVRELRTQRQQIVAPPVDPQAAARAEQEFYASLEMMAPVDAIRAIDQRRTAQFQGALLQQQAQIQDRIDKQYYDAKVETSKVHERYRERVEAALQAEHAVGNFRATRADVLAYLVGQDALKRGERAAPAQRRAAAARVDGQRTRPVGGRGDVAAGGRRPAAGSLEADIALINAAIARGKSVF